MAAPPANAPGPSSGMIAMRIVPSREGDDGVQCSDVTRIFGLPWRLVVARVPSSGVVLHLPPFPGHEYDIRPLVYHSVQLQCAASGQYELWRIRLRLVMHSHRDGPQAIRVHKEVHHTFASWLRPDLHCLQLTLHGEWIGPRADAVSVGLWMEAEGARFGSHRQPPIDSLRAYRNDAALVYNGHRFVVNKQVLSNASLAFLHIFVQSAVARLERENGENKEKNKEDKEKKQTEKELQEVVIDLGGRDPQDFQKVIRMIYRMPVPITENNVGRLLSIADMFDIKFVRDRLENFLLSSTDVTLFAKQTLARVYGLRMLKEELLRSGDLPQNPGQAE